MSRLKDKLKQKVGYDNIVYQKDLMKEAKFNKKIFLGALLSCYVGVYLFLVISPILWVKITLKIIGAGLFLNGLGWLLKSFHFDDLIQDKLEGKTDNDFFKRKKK